MKKLIPLLAAAALACGVHAQDFEGTVTWKMRAEISDPELRAKMNEAQSRMASPEMQAQLKQAQAAMQSPQMQAMMQQNPAMRAMIEKQMAALPKPGATPGGGPASMFPNKFTFKVRGSRSLVQVEGGMFPMEILSFADQHVAYRLDRAGHTYRRMSHPAESNAGPDAATQFKVTPTGETARLLGYNCKRYLVEQVGGASQTTYSVWTTKDIAGLDAKKLGDLRVSRDRGPNFMSQLDGVPLKMEINTPQAKLTMEAEAITPETLPADAFELPAGFVEATD